jgi:hypothetical protein
MRSRFHEECFNSGIVALLMWLKRSSAPIELQEVAADVLVQFFK